MCGLTSIFAYRDGAPPVDREELLRIRDAMINRGPDGSGLWVSNDLRIGLAHRRLAILDLSAAGAQPMSTPDGAVHIVFNGEIYNFRELRRDLEAKGYQFRSDSDTEVLLYLYQEHGRELVHKLRGMYAFAIYDARKQGMFLARDPFGIKPLYYADDGSTLRVASQVKALLKGGHIDTSIEPAGHVGFYLWGHVPEPYTLYKGIRALPAGTSLWIDTSGKKETRQFFNITEELAIASETRFTGSGAEMQECLRAALLDSVRCHLIADVPVGIFLSAGLDSTTIAALAKETISQGSEATTALRTFTLGFEEFSNTPNDEVPIAERFARHLAAQHQTCWVNRDDFQRERQHLLDAMDQPSIDGVNSYFVCKAAAESGLKVALSGLGGDELFGGYPSFRQLPRMVKVFAPFQSIPAIGKGFRYLSAPILKQCTSPKYAGLLEYGGTYGGAYLLRRGMYMPWELPEMLDGEIVRQGWEELKTLDCLNQTVQGVGNQHLKVTALSSTWYMRNQLLRDVDWASMAHSLEVRVPMVDLNLFRTVISLVNSETPLSKASMAATATAPSLPSEILHRVKTGFSIPVQEWLLSSNKAHRGKPIRGLRFWAEQVIRNAPENSSQGLNQFPQSLAGLAGTNAPMHVGLLASEMCTNGGIQSFMHRIVEVMDALAVSPPLMVEGHCFSLNDQTEQLYKFPAIAKLSNAWGASRSKAWLIAHMLFAEPRFENLIVGHLGMAPLALAMKLSGRLQSYFVQLHGIEAWQQATLLERWALRSATGILATTQFTAQECARYNRISAEKFHIIPLCLSDQTANPNPHFRLNGAFKLLCVARQDNSERYKGFEMIFEALAMLRTTQPDVHLNLVGQGNDQSRLRAVAEDLGIASQVTFWGSLADADLTAAYKDCDVFVMPSKKEGFGIVFLEAMKFSKPCIGGNHGGTPDVIEHGKSGYLVEYGDVTVLAGYIRVLMDNASLRQEMGMRGRELVEGKFSWQDFQRNYKKLFIERKI